MKALWALAALIFISCVPLEGAGTMTLAQAIWRDALRAFVRLRGEFAADE